MTKEYSPLQVSPLRMGAVFLRPTQTLPERVLLSDSALTVMTDLSKVAVVTVHATSTMDSANAKMIRYGVRMLLVLDEHEQLVGLLTANDVLGEKPMRFLQSVGGTHAEILVKDIMATLAEVEVIKMADVQTAKVGHIVASLKKFGRQHALVAVDGVDGRQSVCGLFSITQIARLLGAQIQNFELAHSFAEIEAVIAQN